MDSGLEKTVVLWCDGDVSSEAAVVFMNLVSSGVQPDFLFAWINRYNIMYMQLTEYLILFQWNICCCDM